MGKTEVQPLLISVRPGQIRVDPQNERSASECGPFNFPTLAIVRLTSAPSTHVFGVSGGYTSADVVKIRRPNAELGTG